MDTEDGGRWMTFAELAKVRGTSKRAAVMLIRRHGWRRQRNNAGHTIALVPPTWAEPVADSMGGEGDGHSAGHGSDELAPFHATALAALEDALSALRDGHSAEMSALREAHAGEVAALRTLADATGARLVDAEARLSKAMETHGSEVAGLRVRADEAEAKAERAEGERDAAREAHAKAMAANRKWEAADAARKARGRLRRAWDGWQGR